MLKRAKKRKMVMKQNMLAAMMAIQLEISTEAMVVGL
jgi:hypothetical protein